MWYGHRPRRWRRGSTFLLPEHLGRGIPDPVGAKREIAVKATGVERYKREREVEPVVLVKRRRVKRIDCTVESLLMSLSSRVVCLQGR